MESSDRMFGKELTNIMEGHFVIKPRHYSRMSTKVRGVSIDQGKKQVNKQVLSKSSKLQTQTPKDNMGGMLDDQCVPEYFEECLRFMLKQDNTTSVHANYMDDQKEIKENMRGILIDWLIDLHLKFKMFPETIFTIVSIIDRYLTKKSVCRNKLQLVGIAAFFISAKYEETYQVPQLSDLVHFSANAFTKHDILETEADIIKQLDFNLIVNSSYKFFSPLSKLAKLQPKNEHLAQYVLEMSLLDVRFLNYAPSLIAASSIYLINKIRKRSPAWSDLMVAGSGYQEGELKSCARELCYLLENAQILPNTKSLKRKFSMPNYHEVTKIRLERRQKQ